jgi:hypothetical protein
MSPGWIFPIVCLTMMVLCFLVMGRRMGRGGCVGWGHERQARKGGPSERDAASEESGSEGGGDLETRHGSTGGPAVTTAFARRSVQC